MISMFFKRKYYKIKKFIYSTGSILFRSFKVYEIDFINKKVILSIKKNDENKVIKEISLDNKMIRELKKDIFKTKYYLYEERYVNKRIHDGNQWSLIIEYKNDIKKISGSNSYPDNYYLIRKVIDKLDLLLNI